MTATPVFQAILLHDEGSRDRTVPVPIRGAAAPVRLRVPTWYDGAAAYDIYELADDTHWPYQVFYRHTGLITPRTATHQAG